MPGDRPYDPEQLLNLTGHVEVHGPVLNPPTPPEDTYVHRPDYEPIPSAAEDARTAWGGLKRVFTREGREERRAEQAMQITYSQEVNAHTADRILDPRSQSPNTIAGQREKLGWTGTSKRDASGGPVRPEDEVNLGYQLMDYKNGQGQGSDPVPNLLRPITLYEQITDARLEGHREEELRARNLAKWLSDSYGPSLSEGHHRLSPKERKHMRKTAKDIHILEARAQAAEDNFDSVAAGDDVLGQIQRVRWRRKTR